MPKRAGGSLIIRAPGIPANYPIYIADRGWNPLITFCRKKFSDYNYVLISDSGIPAIHIDSLKNALKHATEAGIYQYIFNKGEKNKSLKSLSLIHEFLFEKDQGRRIVVFALGGGVTGDLAGFAAATYKRGIPYIQIPTTLLAQVDSSIGGKTALNNKFGKNMIGVFYHPSAVFINLEVLETLNNRQYLNGMAECIKAGIVGDGMLFKFIMEHKKDVLMKNNTHLRFIVEHSLYVKKKYVEADYYEDNIRKALNFGHTVGHALEKASNYKLLHGEAVALGMMIEAQIIREKGKMNVKDVNSIFEILNLLGFQKNTKYIRTIDAKMLRVYLQQDKKRTGRGIPIVSISKIGKMPEKNSRFIIDTDIDDIINAVRTVIYQRNQNMNGKH